LIETGEQAVALPANVGPRDQLGGNLLRDGPTVRENREPPT
jgi:hypothetical protein